MDSSALVRLLVEEPGSDDAAGALAGVDLIGTSRVSFVECHSAVARRVREGSVAKRAAANLRNRLDAFWTELQVVEVSPTVAAQAAEATRAYALRSLDAIQLASAQTILRHGGLFLSFDRRLCDAAAQQRGWVVGP